MRKIGYLLIAVTFTWLAGVIWSLSWVDNLSPGDFPGRYQLATARSFWSISPAIDRDADAARALKLSWLKASTDINRKEKKDINKIMDVLAAELLFVSDYLESYGKSILPETQARAVIQLLTYLNRFELYQNYPNPALESKIHEFSSGISVATPGTQENWYRETMIRSYLKGNNDLFQENRSQLLRVLNEHGQELTEDFKDGVMSFYDGVLACIQKNPQMAKGSLEIATKKLASYPRLATDFFGGDLNILLIGKGMEDPNGCRQMLNDLLVTGMGVNNGRN